MKIYKVKMSNGEIIFSTNDKHLAKEVAKNHAGSYIVEEELEINDYDEEYDI